MNQSNDGVVAQWSSIPSDTPSPLYRPTDIIVSDVDTNADGYPDRVDVQLQWFTQPSDGSITEILVAVEFELRLLVSCCHSDLEKQKFSFYGPLSE